MPIFTTPTVIEPWPTDHPLFRRNAYPARGVTVLKRQDGTYKQVRGSDPEENKTALAYWEGGRSYVISDEEAASLTEAGYGAYIT